MKYIAFSFSFFSIFTIAMPPGYDSYDIGHIKKDKIINLTHDKALLSDQNGRFIVDCATHKKVKKIGDRDDKCIIDKNKQTIVIFKNNTCKLNVYDIPNNHLKNIKYNGYTSIKGVDFYPYDNNIIAVLYDEKDNETDFNINSYASYVSYLNIKRDEIIDTISLNYNDSYNLSFSPDGQEIIMDVFDDNPHILPVDFIKKHIFSWWCLKDHCNSFISLLPFIFQP